MKRTTGITAIAAAFSLAAFSSVAFAQSAADESSKGNDLNSADVPSAVVDKVVVANQEIGTIRQEARELIESAKNEDEEMKIRTSAAEQMHQAVTDSGLTVDEYNQMIDLYHQDEDFQQRVLKRTQ